VCINKHDLNHAMSDRIETAVASHGAKVVGRVRYDTAMTKAQLFGTSLIEYTGGAVAQDVQSLWRRVVYELA